MHHRLLVAAPQNRANCATGRGFRIAFIGSKCLFDDASGVAHSIRSILELLAQNGARASSLSASLFDANYEVDFAERAGLPKNRIEQDENGLMSVTLNRVRHLILHTSSSRKQKLLRTESDQLLQACNAFLAAERPDIVVTYGSGTHAKRLHSAIRASGAQVVFYLGNAEIKGHDWFEPEDCAIAPSRFLAELYSQQLGSDVVVLHPIISPDRIAVKSCFASSFTPPNRGYVTHLNPTPQKGLTLLIELVRRAAEERPDMRFLALEGVIDKGFLSKASVDLVAFPNIRFERVQRDMATVYGKTSVLLMPSFWREGFGRAAVEAQLSGVPVLASNHGGLPEAMNNPKSTLSIPQACIDDPLEFPSETAVTRWWVKLRALWDDTAAYRLASSRARAAGATFSPERTSAAAWAFFNAIAEKHR